MTREEPVREALTDSEYLLAMIDETFAQVPQVKAHHDRMRKIAAALAALPAQPVEALTDEQIKKIHHDCFVPMPRRKNSYILDELKFARAVLAALPAQPVEALTDEQIREIEDGLPKVGESESAWTTVRGSTLRALYRRAALPALPVEALTEAQVAEIWRGLAGKCTHDEIRYAWGRAALPVPRSAGKAGQPQDGSTECARVERLKDAIEGECEGLVITDQHAIAILQYVDGGGVAGALPAIPPRCEYCAGQGEVFGRDGYGVSCPNCNGTGAAPVETEPPPTSSA